MPLHASFKGHGTFVFNAQSTLQRHKDNSGEASGLTKALKAMDISHAWVRLFGVAGAVAEAPTLKLIKTLKDGGFNVAGWGYCHGADWKKDAERSIELCDHYGLEAFVADVEPGNSTSAGRTIWSRTDFKKYLDEVAGHFGAENLAVSTWPVPKIQDTFDAVELMKIAASRVGMFAPQAYWMRFPKQVHYNATGFKESKYPKDSPESFVRLVADAWRKMDIANPLIVTGQAYWGEGGPDQATMEAKMQTFVNTFASWDKIVGFNWWHAGGVGEPAMSSNMVSTLTAAGLNGKPYASA
ncbi:MAG: hypothetical protein QOH67_2458 [Hyphomicrobiales bacterium]|jgi:hypothetical protein|nr:hypothetical protein [Hyphomicrobiales bacterium]